MNQSSPQTWAKKENFRPYVLEIEWYQERAEGLQRAHQGQMQSAAQLIRATHPDFANRSDEELAAAPFTLEDALLVQAKQHGFESWEEFSTYIASLKNEDAREPFLLAFEAIKAHDNAALSQLLRQEPSLASARGSNGNTLLNLAASFRNQEACQILLDAGALVNLGNNYGWTPLHQAAGTSHLPLAEMFIAAGGDLTLSARGEGGTPLVQALFWGHDAMADLLAQHSLAPRNLRVAAGLGQLDLLVACFDAGGCLTPEASAGREFYRPHGGFPEWSPGTEPQEILDEAFTYACRNGRTQALPFLLERGARIGGDPYQGTALLWAAYKDHKETLRWLVEHGADINQQANFGGRDHGSGVTALHLAAQEGVMEKIRFLVELGANPHLPDNIYNSTAQGWAQFFGHEEAAKYLSSI